MRKYLMIAVLAAMLLLPVGGSAQDPNITRFSVFKATTLSGTAEVVTLQQPAADGEIIRVENVEVWCSVACDITLERDGTAATGTALTPIVKVTYGTAVTNAFHTSDVGVGSVITTKTLPLNTIIPITFPGGLYLAPTGTASNFSVRTSAITGDVKITMIWTEGL